MVTRQAQVPTVAAEFHPNRRWVTQRSSVDVIDQHNLRFGPSPCPIPIADRVLKRGDQHTCRPPGRP